MNIFEHFWLVPLVLFFGGMTLIVVWQFQEKRYITGGVLAFGIFLLLAIVLPSARPARNQAQRNSCLANVKQLAMAVEQWSKENNKVDGDKIDVASMLAYLKGGQMPTCPRGGFYSFSVVGKSPECTLPEHDSKIPPYKP